MIKTGKIAIDLSSGARVVGTVHSAGSLAAAQHLEAESVDLLELRVDAFVTQIETLRNAVPALAFPLLVTVRDFREGGAVKLLPRQRRDLLASFLENAVALDVELRWATAFAPLLTDARERGLAVILSHHDFHATPPAAKLHRLAQRAKKLQADVFKVATTLQTARDFATLLGFLTREKSLPLSVMGMGQWGKVSRLSLAAAGSVLNYGFLDTANASGQWPAPLLKTRIAEVLPSAILKQR